MDYILWVSTDHGEEGVTSRWYGWSRNLRLTYEEAVKEKERLRHAYDDVEIVKVGG